MPSNYFFWQHWQHVGEGWGFSLTLANGYRQACVDGYFSCANVVILRVLRWVVCAVYRKCTPLGCRCWYGYSVVSSLWSVHTATPNLARWSCGRVPTMRTYTRRSVRSLHSCGCGLRAWLSGHASLLLWPWLLPTTSSNLCFQLVNSQIQPCAFLRPSASVRFSFKF